MAASGSSPASESAVVSPLSGAPVLVAASTVVKDPSNVERPPVVVEVVDEPLDQYGILLAVWLPLAGILLALLMEGPAPSSRPARQAGGEISLD